MLFTNFGRMDLMPITEISGIGIELSSEKEGGKVAIPYGLHEKLSVKKSRFGRPIITDEEDQDIYLLLTSEDEWPAENCIDGSIGIHETFVPNVEILSKI